MIIQGGHYLRLKRNGKLFSNIFGKYREITDETQKTLLLKIYKIYNKRSWTDASKDSVSKKYLEELLGKTIESNSTKENITETNSTTQFVDNTSKITDTINKLIDFFSEFSFEPNFRFVNTLYLNSKNKGAREYITNYFELTENAYTEQIKEKIKSIEFQEILDNLKLIESSNKINNRFKIYYGSQGTGKTTLAMKETNNNVMVCHSAMLPADLMEDFKFEDGKANFTPSALQIAMTTGNSIVLDEINLLPFESLRFLQSLLDGKKQFVYKGKNIEIKEGFKIIGTMNLVVNGSTYSLPEPLVDRCEEIKKFKLTAKDLLGALS